MIKLSIKNQVLLSSTEYKDSSAIFTAIYSYFGYCYFTAISSYFVTATLLLYCQKSLLRLYLFNAAQAVVQSAAAG